MFGAFLLNEIKTNYLGYDFCKSKFEAFNSNLRMKIILRLLFIGNIILFLSFNQKQQFDLTEKLIGSWRYNNNVKLFVKINKLAPNERGYEFKTNGEVAIKYVNTNTKGRWCGNDHSNRKYYNNNDNFYATWQATSDSTLIINYHYEDRIKTKHLLIKKLTTNFLAFEYMHINTSSLNDNVH